MNHGNPDFPFASKVKHGFGALLLLAASAFYVYGTCAPAVRITGPYQGFLNESEHALDFSMIDLLHILLQQQSYVPFACTLIFSFVIPVIKFALISATLVMTTCCRRRSCSVWLPLKILRVLTVICKYQLVDVFSVILLVTFINFVGVSVEPLPASQAYLCYCLLSLTSTQWLSHCYGETFERSKQKYAEVFDVSLSNPLLSRSSDDYSPVTEGHSCRGFPMILDNCDDNTSLQASKLSNTLSTNVAASGEEGQQCKSPMGHQGDVRQRLIRATRFSLTGYWSPTSVTISVQGSRQAGELSEVAGEQDPEDAFIRPTAFPRVRRGYLQIIWGRASLYRNKFIRPLAFMILLVISACRCVLRFLCQVGGCLNRLPRGSSPSSGQTGLGLLPHDPSDPVLGHSSSRRRLSEYLVRTFLLTLLFFISAFAFAVCWIRPVLEVSLVPGQQRGFAIQTSSRSLGDIFWRLYSLGHVLSGCGILFVFPVLATFVVYVSSIGAMVITCLLEWSTNSAAGADSPSSRLDDGSAVGTSSLSLTRRRAMYAAKVLSYLSTFAGDMAMPDVQSIGLLTSYFIVNNVAFFGARPPGVPLGTPSGIVDRLLWNFSGFWAMLAFGISASQVHRLSVSFEDVCQNVQQYNHSGESLRNPVSTPAEGQDGSERRLHGDDAGDSLCAVPNCYREQQVGYSASNSSKRMMGSDSASLMDSDEVLSQQDSKEGKKTNLFSVCLFGGIRVAVALALLLPIWQKPVEVMDIDLAVVNNQLRSFVGYVNPSLKNVLPQSLGDCFSVDHFAPPPCTGTHPLAFIRTSVYEAFARWVTGLKTTQLTVIRFKTLPNNQIVLHVAGKITNLALSLRIGECLDGESPGQCPVLWDGTDGCCQGDTTFSIQVGMQCGSDFPYLREVKLLQTRFSQLVVTEKILGILPIEVADITKVVEDQVSEWAETYLDPHNRWIPWTNHTNMSLVEVLNRLLSINAPGGLRCPHTG